MLHRLPGKILLLVSYGGMKFSLSNFYVYNIANGFVCDGQTVNLCQTDHSKSWKVAVITQDTMDLYSCDGLEAGDKLLLFVSKGRLINYGKYELVTAQDVIPIAGDEK